MKFQSDNQENPQKWIGDFVKEFKGQGTNISLGQIIEFITFEVKKNIDDYLKQKENFE